MFTCRDAAQLMTEEKEGTLHGWTRAKYELHMTVCVWCRRCRRQLDEAIDLSRDIAPAAVPPTVEESALAAFRGRRKG